MKLIELCDYLDDYLGVRDVPDSPGALNGLQVENSGSVSKVAVAVDACQATIDQAVEIGADFLLVHHGLFWGGLEPLTGRHGRRVRRLHAHDAALYAAHIPLDVHPVVGNNAVLAHSLGLEETVPFGDYLGYQIGVAGTLAIERGAFVQRVRGALGCEPHLIPGGPERVRRVGVVTGGGGGMIRQALDAGLDTYLTGEGKHHTHFDAEEWGINVVYAGHYATETVGVKALAEHLESTFGIPWQFLDHPTGL